LEKEVVFMTTTKYPQSIESDVWKERTPIYIDIKQSFLKRAFDIVFSFVVLLFGIPVFLFLAILVKISSPGPIFYGSVRVGRSGKLITCWKFRTMHKDAEQILADLLARNAKLRKEWHRYYKLKNDVRITKIGRWLRKTSLDELPQFWNVLKGDLSVVGPRPVSIEEAKRYMIDRGSLKIFSIRPGLTGLWQTSGRNNVVYEKRVELEEKYVDSHSFFLDLRLILKTIPLMIFPKGAF
jgi:exopolysaccharide production protein ExoY